MIKNAEGAAGDFAVDLAALRQDVAHMAETMSKLVQHQTQAAGLRVSDVVGDAKSKIATTAAEAQHRVRTASGDIEAGIQRNPLAAVLIALGVGLALGLLTRSRG
ncbi:MAG: hypothetical protein ACLQJR_09860 [Stellaceae bacterium]